MTTQLPTVDTTIVLQAATQAAEVLPSVHPLTPADAQPGTDQVGNGFPGAVVARVTGHPTATVALLIGQELVDALASSPTPGLELAAAVQPAIDTVAQAVGDVIRLSHPAAAPLDVTTDDAVFAHATPGSKGPKLAALVVGAPKEDR